LNSAVVNGKHLREIVAKGKAYVINPLNAGLNPICYLLALLELTIFSTLSR